MAEMAENRGSANAADGLRFWRGHPSYLAHRFSEIQDLRNRYYQDAFNGLRTPTEIVHFMRRLTRSSWIDPNASIGTTARHGQRRNNPRVTAAFDEKTREIVGFTYMAENVSSKIEPKLKAAHVPNRLANKVGDFERERKIERGRYYIWTSEYVYDGDRANLRPVLGALTLETYSSELPGTLYPWSEENDLKSFAITVGYSPIGEPEIIEGDKAFGEGMLPTQQEPWRVPHIKTAIENMENATGAQEAITQARQTLTEL